MLNHDELSARLADLLHENNLGTRSRWALETALAAAEVESVGGVLVIAIPPRTKERLEVHFTAGLCDVVTRWGAH